MTLRVKLVISITVLLLIVIATVGFVASRSIRSILVAQTDRTLASFADRSPGSGGDGDDQPVDRPTQFLRPFAELVVAPDGTIALAEPSGFADDPDPLPDVSDLGDTVGFVDLESVQGHLDYRAFVEPLSNDYSFVRAAPLNDVATATSELIRSLLIAGIGVLLIGGGVTWWMVRRSLRPVDEMVDTAEAIAAGDLTRRVPDADPATELGRLGESLNEMLTHIEESVEVERESRERMRLFVADASHELRTPLTAIAGYSELRRRGGLRTPEDEDKAWARIESESRRMKTLVEDLLTLARFGQTVPLTYSEVDLGELCADAVDDQRVSDPERTVSVTADAGVRLIADADRIHQVVVSLLSNASVHTPPGTAIEVRASDLGDHVQIVVQDDGPGIDPAAVDHVFDRFYRADPSRSRKSGGSGLGLAIVSAIVTSHGGAVSASNADGGGARFTVTLPKTPTGGSGHDPSASTPPKHSQRMRTQVSALSEDSSAS
jgi:two-component system, OmpR family, sensor kinase